ncbi:DNA polymerase III subunit delta' C-terminal domain-containing protein [Buchnera aphidicola]|uniref:DNA polymerase III subunit delta' C-terminal domain-containing protein n=1 Tax=Buchnera aphidicola TaxID=9 RepID=UPI00209340EB|nr:DNA polymerase III subunit delta' C-terminal domain-containing protein [Buchnera aphidicola]USS94358.1 hypothetical protein M3Y47_00740 [Buchnera aphidicola (Sipha maydis)]WII23517.1 DNA polymerase III subunit delta' C-terminal domain-containing protein [Buchnera aphidicola (Sipha maydis)]
MKLYPWLKKKYKKIILQYLNKKLHHAIIIRSNIYIGSNKLIFFLCKKILCTNSKNLFSCNECQHCKLVESNNYPDLHIINTENHKKTIGIDYFLSFINQVYNTSKLGKKTIVWISKTHCLTEATVNSFLKILEEPPLNTLFFLEYNSFFKLKKTLRSRCIIYDIHPPSQKQGIIWLKKKSNTFSTKNLLISLKLSENSPLLAKKILYSSLWIERKFFFKKVKKSIKKKNLLNLLNYFPNHTKKKVFWIYSLVLDTIKFYYDKDLKLINSDQKKLIKIIQKKNKIKDLYIIINSWKKCFFCLNNIAKVNKKFILLEPLILWENIFHF